MSIYSDIAHLLFLKSHEIYNNFCFCRLFSTALKIIPKKFYFYLAQYNKIADRVKYELKDGKWINYHIAS